MNCWCRTTFIVVLCGLLALPASTAHQRRNQTKPEVDKEAEQRRATAMSMLQALAIDARSYVDKPLRARVQARIADVIWTQDKEAARALFRRAWEIAEMLDEESPTLLAPGQRSSSARPRPRTKFRREVLQLAARRDYKLGEEFLMRITNKEAGEAKTDVAQLSPEEITERLMIAGQLGAENNIEGALQFADPALSVVSERSIRFLVELRDQNAAAADQRFMSLLLNADRDPNADANTVSLLTSYVFSPSVYLQVSKSGIPYGNTYPSRMTQEINPAVRKALFRRRTRLIHAWRTVRIAGRGPHNIVNGKDGQHRPCPIARHFHYPDCRGKQWIGQAAGLGARRAVGARAHA